MTVQIQNQLYLPGRDFEIDKEAHRLNIRALELWAALPADYIALFDQVTLPDPSELPVGSLVRVGDGLYFLKSTGWSADIS